MRGIHLFDELEQPSILPGDKAPRWSRNYCMARTFVPDTRPRENIGFGSPGGYVPVDALPRGCRMVEATPALPGGETAVGITVVSDGAGRVNVDRTIVSQDALCQACLLIYAFKKANGCKTIGEARRLLAVINKREK